jgi:hypothetical protein
MRLEATGGSPDAPERVCESPRSPEGHIAGDGPRSGKVRLPKTQMATIGLGAAGYGTPRHCMSCNGSEAIWDDLNDWHVPLVLRKRGHVGLAALGQRSFSYQSLAIATEGLTSAR